MVGVFKFISFISIYYVFASIVDLYGTIKTYRSQLSLGVNQTEPPKFDLSLNLDVLVISILYLISYYSGVFES